MNNSFSASISLIPSLAQELRLSLLNYLVLLLLMIFPLHFEKANALALNIFSTLFLILIYHLSFVYLFHLWTHARFPRMYQKHCLFWVGLRRCRRRWRSYSRMRLRSLPHFHERRKPWVQMGFYTAKLNPNGSLACLKARLVAKGYSQVYELDYIGTYSPVVKITSTRILVISSDISLATSSVGHQKWLNGILDEEVYMKHQASSHRGKARRFASWRSHFTTETAFESLIWALCISESGVRSVAYK